MRVRLRHDRLQLLLAQSKLSQNHWALKLGLSRGHWSDIVNGRHAYLSPKTRQRMLEVFGVRLEELFVIEPGPTAWSEIDFRAAIAERYLIDQELGQGAMGAVFLARDVARGRVVALKVVSPEAVSGIGTLAFMREISFIAQLNHPHIVPLFDSGVAAEHPFYVMPWMRDGSLRDLLRRRTRLSVTEALPIVRGIAAALQHAHDQRILHCDVKPENVLLHDDHAYVMDFGIARAVHGEVASGDASSNWRARTELDTSAGTPAYVSPEQANGEPDLDARADVYSLACVVYEMLTGRPPFEGHETLTVVAKRFLEPPLPIRDYAPDVPPPVADWVQQDMSIDRAKRPPSAAAFAEGLQQLHSRGHSVMTPLVIGTSRALGRLRRRGSSPLPPALGSLRSVRQDLVHAARGLRRAPRFALAVVIPLALALGAGTAVLELLDRLLLRPPPGVVAPDDIVRLGVSRQQSIPPYRRFVQTGLTGLDWQAQQKATGSFSDVAMYFTYRPSLGRGEQARHVTVTLASASYFPLLGLRPALGRFFQDDEDVAGPVGVPCVASDGFWRRELGSRPALGASLLVGRTRCTVVGVTPPGFVGLDLSPSELWLPIRAGAPDFQGNDPRLWTTDGSAWLRMVARLRPGVTREAAVQEATLAYRSMGERVRDRELTGEMVLEPLHLARGSQTMPGAKTALWLGGGAAVLLLLIGANLVNLFVARHLSRMRETALRLALGGNRRRLFQYHAIEAGLLALAAGLGAVLVARWVGPLLRSILLPFVRWDEAGALDLRVALVSTAIALAIGLLVAGSVAWYTSRVDPVELLRSGGSPNVAGSHRTRSLRLGLVGLQAALSMALVITSAAFVRSFRAAAGVDVGFELEGLVTANVPLSSAGYDRPRRWEFMGMARERLREVPGVLGVSLGYMTPWNNNRNEAMSIPGRDSLLPVPNFGSPAFDAVTPDYLETMGLRLVAGRWISEQDREGAAPVLVVSQSLARHYWPGEASVLGHCIRVGADTTPCREIVGVVADHKFTGGLDDAAVPAYFLPLDQARGYNFDPRLFIRVRGDPSQAVETVRRTIQGLAPDLPAASVATMQSQLDALLASWRIGAIAFTALGVLAAVIAVVGLAGVLSFLVSERRRDFAIRSALGARSDQIAGPVVRQALIVVGLGGVLGGTAVRFASPWLQPQLFHTRLIEPVVVAPLLVLLLGAALLAALGPARRAGTSDPMEVLRAQ